MQKNEFIIIVKYIFITATSLFGRVVSSIYLVELWFMDFALIKMKYDNHH